MVTCREERTGGSGKVNGMFVLLCVSIVYSIVYSIGCPFMLRIFRKILF